MPKENKFSIKAVKHYQEILKSLSQKGIEPWITLCHWTIPQWLSQKGGLENPHFVKYFSQYTAFVLKHLGNYCSYWLIFNEPGIVLAKGFGGRGEWPNQKRNLLSLIKAFNNLKKAHWQAYKLIHQNNQHSLVATSHNLGCWEPSPSTSIKARLLTRFFKFLGNEIFIRSFRGDFLAVQYYFRFLVSSFNVQKKNVFPKGSDMGWEIYPKGIYRVLMDLKKYKLPIYITENGLADAFDQKRTRFIKDHLYWINKAIKEGVPVRGYFYWSFLDNFEWDKGFWTRFGLVAVDYKTQKRTVRKSALVYGKIAQNNGFYL
jgi:beta-glucosidase